MVACSCILTDIDEGNPMPAYDDITTNFITTPLNGLMTTAQAAEATGHTVETLNQYRAQRKAGVRTPGPSFVKIGRAVFYPRLAIEGYLAGRD
jgi:hypothetical protein